MFDYRFIVCCNVIYKVISKLIVRRLMVFLLSVIELNQCAFVEGRLLLENVLLEMEFVMDYYNFIFIFRVVIKFDIFKAFDSVQWEFIEVTLWAMYYLDQFIVLIMCCIKTIGFSVLVNVELEGFFQSVRVVR